jgi:hypothetical protein
LEVYWQDDWKLSVLVARSDDELVGIVPIYVQQGKGIPSLSEVCPIGQGEPEAEEVASEYIDLLIAPGWQQGVLRELPHYLKILADRLNWRAAMTSSHIASLIQKNTRTTLATRYFIDTQNWSPKSLSKNTRTKIQRLQNKLDKAQVHCRFASADEFSVLWPVMKSFHQSHWLNKSKIGAFSSDKFAEFHRKYASLPASAKFSVMEIQGQPIAIHYYLQSENALHFYQSGWDSEKFSELSPGFMLHIWSIKNCNKTEYDFMMGGLEDSYKAKFACQQDEMQNLVVHYSPIKVACSTLLSKIF